MNAILLENVEECSIWIIIGISTKELTDFSNIQIHSSVQYHSILKILTPKRTCTITPFKDGWERFKNEQHNKGDKFAKVHLLLTHYEEKQDALLESN